MNMGNDYYSTDGLTFGRLAPDYLMFNVAAEGEFGCRNAFYLISDQPNNNWPRDGKLNQQAYREEVGTYYPHCTDVRNRCAWAVSSSLYSFVAFGADLVPPSTDSFEVKYAAYGYTAE